MANIDYVVADDWGTGFVANITIPAGIAGLDGWTVEFDAPFAITNIWNAEIVSHVGGHYVVRAAAWNGNVPANGSVSFGFQATPGAGAAGNAPTGFVLNGEGGETPEEPEAPPAISIADVSVAEGNGGAAQLAFAVTLDKPSTAPITVHYATSNGTAAFGSDYATTSGTITFAPGETSKTVQVDVLGDMDAEADETFAVTLSQPTGATIADGAATGTILNDDVVTPPASAASVNYDVRDNWGAGFVAGMTVEAGASALNGWTVEFDASFTITNLWNAEIVSHVGNHYVVRNAAWNGAVGANQGVSFGFQATPGSGGTSATGFTVNGVPSGGEPEPVPPTLSVGDATVVEGSAGTTQLMFMVTLSAPSTTPVTVAYGTADGTAHAGADYAALTGTLTFAPGETSKMVHVAVNGDVVVEGDETLTLTLSAPTGATIGDGSATGTITNDDVAPPLPTLSVGDITFAEGSEGAPGQGMFLITLSAASATAVTVNFATADGTAHAGSDYVATNGSITFAPGETSKMVHVSAIGDGAVEPNKTFSLVLTSPTGATIADGTAGGTITNDDSADPQPGLPTLTVADTSVAEGNPGGGSAAEGWFSTEGNQIVDAEGNTVQIAGVNWFGFESPNASPHGLWTRGYKEMMDQMKDLGFNTIRLPFASDMLHAATASGIDYSKNPDLQGLTPLQIMDKIVDYAGEIGMRIILDHHRSSLGAGTSDNGLWYDSSHSEGQWIADWQMLAERYADDPAVIGADLHNEPYNGTWGGGGANDWAAAAERAGNAIGDVNPNWLIFVEGVGSYGGESYWWGGNLMGVRDRPIDLDLDDKLVYSAHDYGNSVYAQSWFQNPDFAQHLPEVFDEAWGYIYREGIAPVYIGEFGTKLQDPKDAPWLEALTSYMSGDFDNDGDIDIPSTDQGISWTYWSWNPNSGDTGGILKDDWTSVHTDKLAYLAAIQFDFESDVPGGEGGTPGDQNHAAFVITLSEPSADAVTVNYHTVAGDAGESDFTPVSGSLTFAPGETSRTILVPVTADALDEVNETFSLVLTDAEGAVIGVAQGTATILDDDAGTTPPTDPDPGSGGDPSDPAGDLDATFSLVDSWGDGFNASVLLHNDGAATNGWEVEIHTPYQITNIWNAEIVSHDAEGYVIRNAAWNGVLGTDAEVSFGFIGTGAFDPSQVDILV